MKVVIASLFESGFEDSLTEEFPGVDFVFASSEEDQAAEIKDADVFMGSPSRDVFLASDRLRWLHCPGTGIDKLTSIPEIVNSDVVLTNARGPHAAPMADHVMSMCLAFAHRTNEMMADQRAHVWDTGKYDRSVIEMEGSTMGIVALGGIGLAVARRAVGFGMKVYAVDKRPFAAPPGVEAVWGLDRLDDLLRMSDWLVVTAPYTEDTKGMIDASGLALMKPMAHLIVISRGGVVDEDASIHRCQESQDRRGGNRRLRGRAAARRQPLVGPGQRDHLAPCFGADGRDVGGQTRYIQGEPTTVPGQ